MTNYNIKTNQQLIQLFKTLTEQGKIYKLNSSVNRIIEVIDGVDVDREAESLFAEFSELYNIHQNQSNFMTLFRGYLYNIATKEELDNVIKDDLFYSILEFTLNKKEVSINNICLHLFNISSNKVKQELRTHIARCLTHMNFISKRTAKGIKWVSSVEPTQPTLISETPTPNTLQQLKEPTLQPTRQGTQPTLAKDYKEEFETFKELYYKEVAKVKQLIQENTKLLQTNLEQANKIKELENKTNNYNSGFTLKNKATPVVEVATKKDVPDEF